jgi:hypothetical protein
VMRQYCLGRGDGIVIGRFRRTCDGCLLFCLPTGIFEYLGRHGLGYAFNDNLHAVSLRFDRAISGVNESAPMNDAINCDNQSDISIMLITQSRVDPS